MVAYALAGNMNVDLTKDAIGVDQDGNNVYLKDIWPSNKDIKKLSDSFVNRKVFEKRYADLFKGDEKWQKITINKSDTYSWDEKSTYIRLPNFFDDLGNNQLSDVKNADEKLKPW